ncbi:class I SAM-dependent methyltransferase [Emydomyces testavorans]|uniref:Protein arginine methyltransferase NDUFAF7 n=1 Tax=Emydomyces testavorans TaxID=2070801 RepID=A0AAF0DJH5_9EURO|nr:class I SAM-dependent methyltransferase [Emydomyces testavorans]
MSNGATQIANRLARASRHYHSATPSAPIRSLSTAPQRQWSTPLAKTIAEAINVRPISIATYMRQCLTSPEGGYYTSRGTIGNEVFGRRGDFITSPEISQMFGELLGVWTVTEWMAQGKRSSGVQLIEVGPGRGTLMADMLRSIRNFKSFASSIEAVYLVESSPTLRDIQKQMLCGDVPMEEIETGYRSTSKHLGVPVIWAEHIRSLQQRDNDVPFIVAHEFFDALPIHAFQSVASPPSDTIVTPTGPVTLSNPNPSSRPTQWRELVVSVNPATEAHNENRLEFRLSLAKSSTPASLVMPEVSERYKALKPTRGSTIEISPESHAYVQEFARRIGGSADPKFPTRKAAGAALILDYGPSHSIPVNSLRGIKDHRLVSPFTSPGQVDLSADVDFIALAEAAILASPGIEVHGPTEQGTFLQSLGISERAAQLMNRTDDENKRMNIETGWKRLVDRGGGGMGRIYKAMAIVPEAGGTRKPVGFGGQVLA